MISVIYCTREANQKHTEHLIKTSGLHKHIEIIEIINNGESLTKSYNKGLKKAKNDIVVFCHDDLTIETKQWGNKLLKLFERNPEYGIIGVAGTKNMPESGRWWDNPKKMYGRVAHTHEGKTWLSTYSDDLGQELEEVVIVDGLFFAIDKTKIKTKFNEKVEGYHFYEITFCFENYLKGVKLGVTTVIRANHYSIGMTNEQWETNRQIFADNFKDKLPVNVKRKLRKSEKLKVLVGALSIDENTNSGRHIVSLIKNLTKNNCEVFVLTNLNQGLFKRLKQLNTKPFNLNEPPGFKLGDGKWMLKTNEGEIPSKENNLYKIAEHRFDLAHFIHNPVGEHIIKLYPDLNFVMSVTSDTDELDRPVLNDNVKYYLPANEIIKNNLVENFNLDKKIIEEDNIINEYLKIIE